MIACSFFAAGCHQQQAIDLYLDAVMLKELGEDEMAIEKLEAAAKANKRFSSVYSMLGEVYRQKEDYDRSAASYERAIELKPWSFEDHFKLGQVYEKLGKFARAGKAYVRACDIKPDHLEAHTNAARCYCEVKNYGEALAYAERAEQLDKDVSQVQVLLGDIYKCQKDYDRAIKCYERALDIESNNPDVMVALAIAYLKTHRYSSAKELLTLATKTEPDNGAAYATLGYCCLKLGDADKAILCYSRAAELDYKDWQAHRGLGVAYMVKAMSSKDEQLRSKAIQQWRLSLHIEPNQPGRETLLRLMRDYSQ
jgi:tetratricopeptide (TPR) repeat protein